MRTYVITSGTVFALLVAAHVVRAIAEGPHVVRDPLFVLITLVAALLSAWAFRVARS